MPSITVPAGLSQEERERYVLKEILRSEAEGLRKLGREDDGDG